jgi:hypothetical protein
MCRASGGGCLRLWSPGPITDGLALAALVRQTRNGAVVDAPHGPPRPAVVAPELARITSRAQCLR